MLFPHDAAGGLTKKEAQALVSKANKERKKRLKSLTSVGGGKDKLEAQKVYLGSELVRLAALVEAAKGQPLEKRLSINAYEQMAAGLKLHLSIPEEVGFYLKPKSSGDFRCICVFGVRHRAAQSIVADMVAAQFWPQPYQYNVAGKGVRKAVKQVRKYIALGFKSAVRMDIRSFYDSFTHAELMNSNITSKAVIEHVIIGRDYDLKPLSQKGGSLSYAEYLHHRGIAQGSACSPIIGNFYISKLKCELPQDIRFLNYADDFLILGKSDESLEKATNALQASVKALTVGEFELLEKSGSSSVSGFEFLGHHFEVGLAGLQVRLTDRAEILHSNETAAWIEKIDTLLTHKKKAAAAGGNAAMIEGRIEDALVKWASKIKGWHVAFSEVDDIDQQIAFHKGVLLGCCEKADKDGDEIFKSATTDPEAGLAYGVS